MIIAYMFFSRVCAIQWGNVRSIISSFASIFSAGGEGDQRPAR